MESPNCRDSLVEASLRLGLVPMLLQLLDWRQGKSSSQVTVQHDFQPVIAEAALMLGPAASGWAVTAENSPAWCPALLSCVSSDMRSQELQGVISSVALLPSCTERA